MRLDSQDIDNIRKKADIVDIIGRYIPVEKKGNAYKAVCPFHDDHDPSLSIKPSMQIFKCFVCGKAGNVFGFVEEYEHISFTQAVKKVAQMVDYALDIKEDNDVSYNSPYNDLYKLLNEMVKYTHYSLNTSVAINAKKYLNEVRKLDDKLIDMFEIGYDASNDVYKFLKAKNYSEEDMLKVNIIGQNDYGYFDIFSNRITFPIHDSYGNPIGFSARSLIDGQSKYINTSTTDIYIKGNFVYNMHRAKAYAKKENKIILVEGVMDVIAYAKVGIYNVVASLGTSLTEKQLALIKQCSMNVILAYDPDMAGQNAIYKAGLMAVKQGFNVYVSNNSSTLDPDELVSNYGSNALLETINKPLTWMEFLFKYLQIKYNLDIYDEKKMFTSKIVEQIDMLKDDYDRLNYQHQLENIIGFSISNLIKKSNTNDQKIITNLSSSRISGLLDAQKQILANLLVSKEACNLFLSELGYLPDDDCNVLAMIIVDEYRKFDMVEVSRMIDDIDDPKINELLLSLMDAKDLSYDVNCFMGAMRKIKIDTLKNLNAQIKRQIKTLNDLKLKQQLIIKLDTNNRELRKLYDEETN